MLLTYICIYVKQIQVLYIAYSHIRFLIRTQFKMPEIKLFPSEPTQIGTQRIRQQLCTIDFQIGLSVKIL